MYILSDKLEKAEQQEDIAVIWGTVQAWVEVNECVGGWMSEGEWMDRQMDE